MRHHCRCYLDKKLMDLEEWKLFCKAELFERQRVALASDCFI